MSSSSPQLPLGQVIGSRYRVQSLIGRGGMGMVYGATHELTGRRVALKIMVGDSDDSPVLQERFLSEARIAATVRHPNIVDVLDMGLHEGSPYLVMELLEGVSLERVLAEQKRLSVEQAIAWLLPIIGALGVLHEAGIVHRDVKPSNIFLSTLPRHPMRPKLLDFGLARVVSDLRLTRSGTVIGTPLYMAPEHAAGYPTGPQADIWSIGVVLFEVLTGGSPFQYTDRASLAAQVLAGMVRPLNQVRPDLPELISVALGRALQRDLSRRYPDMRAFAQGLHAAAVSSRIAVPFDPDPIGLPDYQKWQSGDHILAVTREQLGDKAPTPSAPWTAGVSVDQASDLRPSRKKLLIGLALGMCVVALIAWLIAAPPDAPPVARPEISEPAKAEAPAVAPAATSPKLPLPTVEAIPPTITQPSEVQHVRPTGTPRNKAGRPKRLEPMQSPNNNNTHVDEVEAEWK